MGGTGRKSEPPKKGDDKSKKPEHVPVEDDDYEDGDFATPKRDRHRRRRRAVVGRALTKRLAFDYPDTPGIEAMRANIRRAEFRSFPR